MSNATGKMTLKEVAPRNPFKQSMLSSHECYILDNGRDHKIFFWKGS